VGSGCCRTYLGGGVWVARCKFRDTDGVTRRVERRGPLDEFDKHGKLAEVPRIDEVSDGLSLWLALHEPAMAWVSTIGAAADRALVLGVYYAVRKPVALGTAALVSTDSLAALVRLDDEQPFELGALPLGPDGHHLAQRLVEHIHDWDTRGRPCTTGLHVSAYPHDTDPTAITDPGTVIDKRYNRLALTWAS
jgi:protein-L-isoaspartate(D-aspartate) O-methyltransferase